MKFVCDRCGKKYATAEDPSPGKVYKLKCRACGHLMVVKAQAGTSTTIPALSVAELAGAQAAVPPAPELEIEMGLVGALVVRPTGFAEGTHEALIEQSAIYRGSGTA